MSVTRIEVEDAAVDQPLEVRVRDVRPGAGVTLRTSTLDSLGRTWYSENTRRANGDGIALFGDVASAAEVEESEAFRVLGSLRLEDPSFPPLLIQMPPVPARLTFTVFVDGADVAAAQCSRFTLPGSVTRTEHVLGGLPGVLFEPATSIGGVLLLSGSGGGLLEPQAALLAAHGFSVLTLAYFGMPELPPTLTDIELRRFDRAVEFLAARTPGGRVAIAGTSRGGELALLLASRRPSITAAVAYLPSAWAHSGIGASSSDGIGGIVDTPAWVEDGEPIPFLGPSGSVEIREDGVLITAREYLAQLQDPDPRASIPVEEISGPVFIVGAGDDAVWPSAEAAKVIERRLVSHPYPVDVLTYPGVGHGLAYMTPHVPTPDEVFDPYAGNRMAWGGSPDADADARADAWPRMIAFLQTWAKA